MVDDLTNESFQTGKAIVSIGTELIQAIVKACRESEQNKALTREDKDTVLSKVVDKVTDNYKETHGSVKRFNREGIDVAHQEVADERVAKILEQNCKKMHLPVELKATENADGTKSYTAFCEVKNIDQLTALLKMSSQQVLEEEKAMTKTLTVLNDKDQEIFSQSFIHEKDIDYEKLSNVLENGGERFEFKEGKLLDKGSTREENAVGKIKEKASTMEPKKKKSLSERIKDKKEISEKKDKNRQREKTKQKSKKMNQSR